MCELRLLLRSLVLFVVLVDTLFIDDRTRRAKTMLNQTSAEVTLASKTNSTLNESSAEVALNAGARFNTSSLDYGTFDCMRWTTGTCQFSGCKKKRGPTICEHGRCMCQEGYCATAKGTCDRSMAFKMLGKFAIKFKNPWDASNSYLGAAMYQHGFFGFGHTSHVLALSSDSTPHWKVASVGPEGLVRFQSEIPGHEDRVVTIYNNRRRRSRRRREPINLLTEDRQESMVGMGDSQGEIIQEPQVAKDESSKSRRAELSDNEDLWPMVKSLSPQGRSKALTPLDATFQLRVNEKADEEEKASWLQYFRSPKTPSIEIWDPQRHVALVNVKPKKWFGDISAKNGIAECNPWGWLYKCDNVHSIIEFEPPLPSDIMDTLASERMKIHPIGSLYLGQVISMIVCSLCCCCCCIGGCFLLIRST